MTVRIGWTRDRPRARAGKVAGGVYLLEILKTTTRDGRHLVVGLLSYSRADLERLAEKGVVIDVRVFGALRFAPDVTPASIDRALGTIRVTGPLLASPTIKTHLKNRTS